MRALSIRQPWAWAIIHAGKDIENRNWETSYRGPILIHAAKGMTRHEYEYCLYTIQHISRTHPFPAGLTLPTLDALEHGGIIGCAEIVDCVREHPSPWFSGPFGFILANAEPLPFRAYRGQLGLFEVGTEL